MQPNPLSKRFLSFVLSAFLLIPMFAMPVSAEPKDTRTADAVAQKLSLIYNVPLSVDETEKLKKFNGGENYLLITFENSGYAIVHRSTGQIVEAGLESPSPYQGIAKNNKVYGGIMNYAYKLQGKYYTIGFDDNADTLIPDEAKEANIAQMSVYETLAEKQAEAAPGSKGISAAAKTINQNGVTYINNYTYIRTMDYGDNVNNTCGSVAAGMLLTFYQVHRGVTVLPAQYRPGSTLTSPTSPAEALHQNLQYYCEKIIGKGGKGYDIATGINDRQATWFGANKRVTAVYASDRANTSTAKTAMNQDKPVILGTNVIPKMPHPYGDHWLLGYAWWEEGGTRMYMAHTGYKDSRKNDSAIVNELWMKEIVYLNVN